MYYQFLVIEEEQSETLKKQVEITCIVQFFEKKKSLYLQVGATNAEPAGTIPIYGASTAATFGV